MDQIIGFIGSLLGSSMFAGLPIVGKILIVIVSGAGMLSGVVTGFVALWHALVIFLQALALVPFLAFLQGGADFLKAEESKVSDFAQGTLIPLLNRLSVIPLPQKSAGLALK